MLVSLKVNSDGSSSEDKVEVMVLGVLFRCSRGGGTLLLKGSSDIS